jgi:hypothetical protein
VDRIADAAHGGDAVVPTTALAATAPQPMFDWSAPKASPRLLRAAAGGWLDTHGPRNMP